MRAFPLLMLALPLAACLDDQPPRLARPIDCAATSGTAPTFGCANTANLAAMVADPADLTRGRAFTGADAALDAAAVERLRLDKVKPLRGSGTTDSAPAGPQ